MLRIAGEGLTVIVIASDAVSPFPSLTVNVTVWLPASLLPGVQLNVLSESEEPEGLPDTEYVNVSPSASEPDSANDNAVPSTTDLLPILLNVGFWLVLLTVIVIDTVAAEEVTVPSDTVNVKLSEPL